MYIYIYIFVYIYVSMSPSIIPLSTRMFGTGTEGSDIGQLSGPDGVFVTSGTDPMVYVAESGNDRVQVFRATTGEHVR